MLLKKKKNWIHIGCTSRTVTGPSFFFQNQSPLTSATTTCPARALIVLPWACRLGGPHVRSSPLWGWHEVTVCPSQSLRQSAKLISLALRVGTVPLWGARPTPTLSALRSCESKGHWCYANTEHSVKGWWLWAVDPLTSKPGWSDTVDRDLEL